jgi:hypothetical protein
MTVPPTVLSKTRGKHIYMTPEWRVSYARRTGVERAFGNIKDDAAEALKRGRCRLYGRATYQLLRALAYVVRNLRVLKSFAARQARVAAAAAGGRSHRHPRRMHTDTQISDEGAFHSAP